MNYALWFLLFLYVCAIYSTYVNYRDPCRPRMVQPPEGEDYVDDRFSRPVAFALSLVWWWPLVLMIVIGLAEIADTLWRKLRA